MPTGVVRSDCGPGTCGRAVGLLRLAAHDRGALAARPDHVVDGEERRPGVLRILAQLPSSGQEVRVEELPERVR